MPSTGATGSLVEVHIVTVMTLHHLDLLHRARPKKEKTGQIGQHHTIRADLNDLQLLPACTFLVIGFAVIVVLRIVRHVVVALVVLFLRTVHPIAAFA